MVTAPHLKIAFLLIVQGIVNVSFGQPPNVEVVEEAGERLSTAKQDAQAKLDERGDGVDLAAFHFVDKARGVEVVDSDVVWNSMEVVLCHVVVVVGDVERDGVFVEHGQHMNNNTSSGSDVLTQLVMLFDEGVVGLECTATATGVVVDCGAGVDCDVTVHVTNITRSSSTTSSSSSLQSSSISSTSMSSFSSSPSLSSLSSSLFSPSSPSSSLRTSSAPSSSSSSILSPTSTSSSSSKTREATHEIVLEFDGTVVINQNITEQSIKDAIIDVFGNAVVVTNIEVVVDASGLVTSVVVDVVGDDEAVRSVVDTIESHSSKDDCGAGVLCRVAKVTLRTIRASPSWHTARTPTAVLLLLAVVAWGPRF